MSLSTRLTLEKAIALKATSPLISMMADMRAKMSESSWLRDMADSVFAVG